jgi:hypothetical protein
MWRMTPGARRCYRPGWMTGVWTVERYMETSESLEQKGTLERLTSSVPGSLVSPIVTPGQGLESSTPEISGPKHERSFGWWDASGSCLRTFQASFLEMMDGKATGSQFLESFPSWGLMLGGEFIAQPTPGRRTSENGGGCWPTPTGEDANNVTRASEDFQSLSRAAQLWPTPATSQDYKPVRPLAPSEAGGTHGTMLVGAVGDVDPGSIGGSLNPDWVEQHLMSLPEGWTRLEPVPDGAYDEWFGAMRDGTWWDTERGLPRVTTGAENRVNRLKMLGNGIVPATLALFLTNGKGDKQYGKARYRS